MRTAGRWGTDVLAGVTLALLAVPEVLGYARIAGMPVVTALCTMLLPMAANVTSWSATGWPRPSGGRLLRLRRTSGKGGQDG